MVEPRPHEPLVSGVRDGVEHGYRALETVLEGMRGSMERVAAPTARPRRTNPTRRGGGRPITGSHDDARRAHTDQSESSDRRFGGRRPLSELFDVMTDLVSYAGDVAVGVAGELTHVAGADPRVEPGGGALVLRPLPVPPGGTARVTFHLHNRTPRATDCVTFTRTDLVGSTDVIPDDAVRFDPGRIEGIGPHGHAEVDVVIEVPMKTPAGMYRGIVHATLGDAWVVVELEVAGRRR